MVPCASNWYKVSIVFKSGVVITEHKPGNTEQAAKQKALRSCRACPSHRKHDFRTVTDVTAVLLHESQLTKSE